MKREMPHDFYLLKAKVELNLNDDFYMNLGEKAETDQYIYLDTCYFHNEFIEYMYPSFTGMSTVMNFYGVSLIKEKADARKIVKIAEGWIVIIQEIPERVTLNVWDTEFYREDLLLSLNKLKNMAVRMAEHDDYNIFYWGI